MDDQVNSTIETIERQWIETTYGARWPNTRSPRKYQIWRMTCIHCGFHLDPCDYRHYDEYRKDHPQPYGNMASISHARKVIREHVQKAHARRTVGGKFLY